MTSNNFVYIMTTESNQIYATYFDPLATSPITPNYFKSYGDNTYTMNPRSVFIFEELDVVYAGGRFQG